MIFVKRLSLMFLAFLTAFGITGCGGVVVQDETKRREATGESWTIMIYMCASTLEENYNLAGKVIGSMAYDLPENVNVLIETGGSRDWSIDDVDNEYLQYYTVQKNGIRLVNQLPSVSMGESSALSDFIKWSAQNYPAKHYMTVIWGQGGGPLGGVVYDSKYDFDSLSVRELKSALGSAGIKMDLIGFDASLTSNLETAAAVSMYSDYMVASEGIMPASGWDYEDLFYFISANPQASASSIGQEICIGAAGKANDEEAELMSMAVIDLSKETMLSQAFDGVAQTLADATGTAASLGTLRSSLDNIESIGANTQWEGYSNIADMGELVSVLGSDFGSPAAHLKNALGEAVVCKYTGKVCSGHSGLGFWYPSHRDGAEIAKYRDISNSAGYIEYLEKTAIDVDVPDRRGDLNYSGAFLEYTAAAETNTVSAVADFDGRFVMAAVHPELISSAYVNIYKYSKKESRYIYICSDYNTSYDAAAGGYVYTFDGKLPKLGGADVSLYSVSHGAAYDIYSIPVMCGGELMNIRALRYIDDNGAEKYRVSGIWKGNDPFSGIPDRKLNRLRTGDVIIPLYEIFGESRYVEGNRVRIGLGEVKLAKRKIGDGDYLMSFTAEDIYGIKHESNTAAITASRGNIRITAN